MHVEKLHDIGQHSIHDWHSTAIQVWGNFSWHGSVFTVTLLINWSYLLMIAWRIADCLTVIAFIFLTTTCSVIFGNLKLDINVMMILNRLNGYAFGRSANVNTNRRPYTLSVACLGSNTANTSEQSVVGSWVRRICSTTSRTPSGCPSHYPLELTQCMMISANSSGDARVTQVRGRSSIFFPSPNLPSRKAIQRRVFLEQTSFFSLVLKKTFLLDARVTKSIRITNYMENTEAKNMAKIPEYYWKTDRWT